MKRIAWSVAALALLTVEARAQWGYQAGYYPQFYGRNVYTIYDQDRIPYFALHPPVYYSAPVPRTYGYSPFAYPGNYRTPDVVAPVDPVTIVNPYYDAEPKNAAPQTTPAPKPQAAPPREMKSPGKTKTPAANRSAEAAPRRILNPFAGPQLADD